MTDFLVTGAAGFIGYHTSLALLDSGHRVYGLDNLNPYYAVSLKEARLRNLSADKAFTFHKVDLADREGIERVFAETKPSSVINLAAQAGVRYSIENPHVYVDSNLVGFLHILEGCRNQRVEHLVFASSSSVYGANTKMPFSTDDRVDYPVSLYAATKKANELMAHTYSHLYGIPTTGLRFFTVYGPWGRPDMAPILFTKAITEGKPINVFNHGQMKRDFTYVDDIVEGILRVMARPPAAGAVASDDVNSNAAYKIYNIGNNQPVELSRFIEILEDCIGKKAIKNLLPMQAGDVHETYADIDELVRDTGFQPSTSLETGLARFVDWYRSYYGE